MRVWGGFLQSQRYGRPVNLREQMIRETNAFLSWSLARDRGLPRIPRRRVDQGGFNFLARHAGARLLAIRWWMRVLADHRIEL